jgi:hypothetical protein
MYISIKEICSGGRNRNRRAASGKWSVMCGRYCYGGSQRLGLMARWKSRPGGARLHSADDHLFVRIRMEPLRLNNPKVWACFRQRAIPEVSVLAIHHGVV